VARADRVEAALGRLWWRRETSFGAWLLAPLAWCYGALTGLRRLAFEAGWRRASQAPVAVIVVGNLIAGGAGKTPTVIALVRALQLAGWTPGVISRGHGRQGTQATPVYAHSRAATVGDEPLLIHLRTHVPVWVARRRIDAARALCAAQPGVNVLVADDGLQHLALARQVQVIVFDERGVGNGRLLPAGPLRQPLSRYVPVNTHVLYNAMRPSTPWPGALARRALAGAVSLQDWWCGTPASRELLQALRGRALWAAAGMAAPLRFFDMLRAEGLQFTALALPDHFAFEHLPWPAHAGDVLVTEKDAVKLPPDAAGGVRIWVVALDFQLPADFTAAVLHNLRLAHRP
jgi:tetraacyldisaccharide 4'-kinase